MNPKLTAAIIFFASYCLLVIFRSWKSRILWIGIAAGMIAGLVAAEDIIHDINWNVMGIFAGTLFLAEFFIISGVPAAIASFLVRKSANSGIAFLYVCVLSSVLSAFIENVAVVLIVAPIALDIARKVKVSPIPVLIGIAVASNLQGTATLIGDPPSMILANFQKMNFNDFFVYRGEPGIFFAVEAGAIISMAILYLFFRKRSRRIEFEQKEKVNTFVPTLLITIMVIGLALSSLIDPDFEWFGGTLCLALAVVCLVVNGSKPGRTAYIIRRFDWSTTAFLAGVFVIVGMLERTGLITGLAAFIGSHIGSSRPIAFLVIVWGSVAFSAFIDNVPYITAMIPVVQAMARSMGGGEELLVFGLLIGACLGGNITPVGASANVVSVGILRKQGYPVSFGKFVKVGLPFTIAATLAGSAVIYLVWGA